MASGHSVCGLSAEMEETLETERAVSAIWRCRWCKFEIAHGEEGWVHTGGPVAGKAYSIYGRYGLHRAELRGKAQRTFSMMKHG